MVAIRQHVRRHHSPVVMLGRGKKALKDIFHALFHCFYVETMSVPLLVQDSHLVFATCGDMGTESTLNRVKPVPVTTLFPWLAAPVQAETDDGDWEEDLSVDIQESFSINGMMHILHNLGTRLLEALPVLAAAIVALAQCANLLRKESTCKRLLETCFDTAVGRTYHRRLRGFQGQVYYERWGTIAYCVKEMLKLRWILWWGWDVAKYKAGDQDHPADPTGAHSVHLDVICSAWSSFEWWEKLRVSDYLYDVIRSCVVWCDTCVCHGHLLGNEALDIPDKLRQLWQSCLCRGRRVPELAAGDLLEMVRDLLNMSATQLALSFPQEVDDATRVSLIVEFERGRAFIVFTLTFKLHAFGEDPLYIFACAHHDRVKSFRAVRHCFACNRRAHISGTVPFRQSPWPRKREHFSKAKLYNR